MRRASTHGLTPTYGVWDGAWPMEQFKRTNPQELYLPWSDLLVSSHFFCRHAYRTDILWGPQPSWKYHCVSVPTRSSIWHNTLMLIMEWVSLRDLCPVWEFLPNLSIQLWQTGQWTRSASRDLPGFTRLTVNAKKSPVQQKLLDSVKENRVNGRCPSSTR